ncbi:CYTH domain-containing protein [Candidatus Gracilibacteria bacterium]|nr:CYTH domain-containing protein [Candidatus Gracilibacteria bacterium]
MEDGVHQRAEWEFPSETPHPATWPVGEARAIALGLLADAALVALLTIDTQRRVVYVKQGGRAVAELALDHGVIVVGARREPIIELEIELRQAGTRADLDALAVALREHIAIVPEPRSKLARGLALLAATV